MNKQVIFYIIAAIAALGVVGVIVLQLIRPDASATLINFVFTLLPVLAGFGGLAAMQAQQNKEIETIKKNTNGTLSRKEHEIAAYRAVIAEHAPEALREVDTVTLPTVTRTQLRADREGGE